MAVKPITGMLKRALIKDVSVALGLGIGAAYVFWLGFHLPSVRKRNMFYEKLYPPKS
ncbi:cytochrome c oxidase subunit VIIa [Pneumocystis jirovecii RU7]|uniref:Cytochrome c oxidase polypeptide VIIA n=1 Tax=Pneumocystis jirovecii (strain RU7) TaxID=1408657 RepID=A0A0W4ZM65_PNEJ7|nr:cytochrome c oxidase subunit VIIa [Pneumocystis jirovecii RU7]KTW29479.1 hypothetical protein T551_02095 [Pneumocystis jirovecii RU7]